MLPNVIAAARRRVGSVSCPRGMTESIGLPARSYSLVRSHSPLTRQVIILFSVSPKNRFGGGGGY